MGQELLYIGKMHGELTVATAIQPLSSGLDRDIVSLTSEQWNTRDHLKKFIDRASLFSIQFNGQRVHLMVSDTPYANKHVMILQENSDMLDNADWRRGEVIHDQNESAKLLYWFTVLRTLKEVVGKSGDRSLVVFSENTTRQVTHEAVRLPRSIRLIHGHVTEFPIDNIQEIDNFPAIDIDGFSQERDYWNQIGEAFVEKINSYFKYDASSMFTIREGTLPPGYQIEINHCSADIKTARRIAELLTDHHKAYSQTVSLYDSSKPQPSYRTYIELTPAGKLRISISPIFYSHAGSINAAGIFMNRIVDPNFSVDQKRGSAGEMFRMIGESIYNGLIANGQDAIVLRPEDIP